MKKTRKNLILMCYKVVAVLLLILIKNNQIKKNNNKNYRIKMILLKHKRLKYKDKN